MTDIYMTEAQMAANEAALDAYVQEALEREGQERQRERGLDVNVAALDALDRQVRTPPPTPRVEYRTSYREPYRASADTLSAPYLGMGLALGIAVCNL